MTYYVQVKQRLGNQLFQWAFGVALRDRFGVDVEYDTHEYDLARQPGFGLLLPEYVRRFAIAPRSVSQRFLRQRRRAYRHTVGRLRKLVGDDFPYVVEQSYFKARGEIKSLDLDALLSAKPTSFYFSGFWQSHRYLEKSRTKILSELCLPDLPTSRDAELIHAMKEMASVALHVRLGDYLNVPEFAVQDVAYYSKAIESLSSDPDKRHYFLFAEDSEVALKRLPALRPEQVTYVGHYQSPENSHLNLPLMVQCKEKVIANSSFSWWAAWINEGAGVVAPRNWFSSGAHLEGLFPPTWRTV